MPADDLAAALVRRAEGHRGVALDAELVLLVREHVGELGVAEQRLGRDAADVEADPAPVLLLDDGHGLAELGRADRRDVTTGAGTKDENVEVGHGGQPMSWSRARPTQGLICGPVTLYAAYGTNLDPARMGERCPHSPMRTTGWLTGWRLTFGGEEHGWDGALSTIVEDPIEQVFVAVYDVTREDEAALDGWESADSGLYRKTKVRVSTMTGELVVLDLRPRRLRGRPALRVVPRGARGRRRGRRRARRLRRRPAPAPLPLDRELSGGPAAAQSRAGGVADRLDVVAVGVAHERRRSSARGTPARAAARAAPPRPSAVAASKKARTVRGVGRREGDVDLAVGPGGRALGGCSPIQKSGPAAVAEGDAEVHEPGVAETPRTAS